MSSKVLQDRKKFKVKGGAKTPSGKAFEKVMEKPSKKRTGMLGLI